MLKADYRHGSKGTVLVIEAGGCALEFGYPEITYPPSKKRNPCAFLECLRRGRKATLKDGRHSLTYRPPSLLSRLLSRGGLGTLIVSDGMRKCRMEIVNLRDWELSLRDLTQAISDCQTAGEHWEWTRPRPIDPRQSEHGSPLGANPSLGI